MPEYLENPRRAVRARLRCTALLARASGTVKTATEDLGAQGCRLKVPSPAPRGELVGLTLSWPAYDRALRVTGAVAWASSRPPYQMGIAFLPESLPHVLTWLDGLIAADPSVLSLRDAPPKRVDLDAKVFLAPPSRAFTDFTDDELAILQAVRLGVTLRALRQQMGGDQRRLAQVVFALLSRQAITLSRAEAANPSAWSSILNARPAALIGDLDGDPATPMEIETFDRIREQTARTPAPLRRSEVLPDPARSRSRDAQQLLNNGLAELELRRPTDALGYLRRALVLSPGDPEILGAIGRATSARGRR